MPIQYGYKLFRLQLRNGNSNQAIEFQNSVQHAGGLALGPAELLEETCRRFGDVAQRGPFNYRNRAPRNAADEQNQHEMLIKIVDCDLNNNMLQITFRYGREDSHDVALAARADREETDLDGLAPSNLFRAWILLPREGTFGAMICEARGRYCPAPQLLRCLCTGMRDWVNAEVNRDAEAEVRSWWRIKDEPIVDDDHVRNYIRRGRPRGVKLKKYAVGPDGVRRRGIEYILQDNYIAPVHNPVARALVAGWRGVQLNGDEPDEALPQGEPTAQVAAFVEPHYDPDDFDDVEVDWEGPDGTHATYSPHMQRDPKFFPIGRLGARPTDQEILVDSTARLRRLRQALRLNIPALN